MELRKNFLELVPSSENLLFFMKNFNKLSFSAGIRNCLSKWYEKKSPDELIEIIFGLGKFEKLSHGEIVRKLHPKSENAEKQEVFAAAYKDYNQISEAAKTSTTLKKILVLKDLKRCQNVAEVVEILKKNEVNFKLHHIPTFAVKTPEAIELILPNLTISELISSLPVFAERKLLKDSTAKKISSSLQCSAKIINEAKLNPVKIFEVIRKLSGPEIPVVKKEETVETEKKEKRVMYPQIVQKLRNIFNQSLSEQPKTGCRFFITLDVRKFSKRREYEKFKKNSQNC